MPTIERVKSSRKGKGKVAATTEIGIAYSEFDSSGRGDAEFIPALRGSQGIRTYRQMAENDATISSVVFAVEMSLRNVDWRLEPATSIEGEASTSDEDLNFMHTALFDDMEHSFSDFIAEALTFLIYGWDIHEIVLKMRDGPNPNDKSKDSLFNDGRIGIRKLSLRPQSTLHRWQFNDDGTLKAMEQHTTTKAGTVVIPMEKCIHFRTTSGEGSPEGKSMLRGAYRSWYLLRQIEHIEAIAIERELNGLPVIYVPADLLAIAAQTENTPERQAALATVALYEQAVKDVKLNTQGSMVLPSDVFANNDGTLSNNRQVIFELVSSNGTRSIDTNTVINRYQSNIMRTVLADFILLGSTQGTSGSFALGTDRSQMFAEALGGWLQMVQDTLNRSLIRPLWAMNGLPIEETPILMHGRISRESLDTLAGYVQKLAAAGMPLFPDEQLEDYLRRLADLPAASEELDDIRDEKAIPDMEKQKMMMAEQAKHQPKEGGKPPAAGGKGKPPAKGGKPPAKKPAPKK